MLNGVKCIRSMLILYTNPRSYSTPWSLHGRLKHGAWISFSLLVLHHLGFIGLFLQLPITSQNGWKRYHSPKSRPFKWLNSLNTMLFIDFVFLGGSSKTMVPNSQAMHFTDSVISIGYRMLLQPYTT